MASEIRVELSPALFGETERPFLTLGELKISTFRYDSGVAGLRLANARGHLVLLPYLGQMVWDAVFDGVDLTMANMFAEPRQVASIDATYGCFAFHSGMLRNGCPSPQDNHLLHGEMPCARLDRAWLVAGEEDGLPFVRLEGEYEYVMGFGSHYLATPSVTLAAGRTLFDIRMKVRNIGGAAMDLMYMCHVNFAFSQGAEIVQAAPYTPERTRVRSAIPGHVPATPAYRAFIDELMREPAVMRRLDQPERYDPEQVFYIEGLATDARGRTQAMLRRPEGDGFFMCYDTAEFPKTVRWILANADQKVAAFALPSTCEPEGYLAEKAKGNLRRLSPGEEASFHVRTGYVDRAGAEALDARIRAL